MYSKNQKVKDVKVRAELRVFKWQLRISPSDTVWSSSVQHVVETLFTLTEDRKGFTAADLLLLQKKTTTKLTKMF